MIKDRLYLIILGIMMLVSCKTGSQLKYYNSGFTDKELASIYTYMIADFTFTGVFDRYDPLIFDQTDKKEKYIYILQDYPYFSDWLIEHDFSAKELRSKKEVTPFDNRLLDQIIFPYDTKVVNFTTDDNIKKLVFSDDVITIISFSGLYKDNNMYYLCVNFYKAKSKEYDYWTTYVMGLKRCHSNSAPYLEKYEVLNSQVWLRKNHESDLDCDLNEEVLFDPNGREN